jgi:hypothetical protein
MLYSLAELHVRAVVRDSCPEPTADRLLGDKNWLDAQVEMVLGEVSKATAGITDPTTEQEAIGLDRYTDFIREKLREMEVRQ